MTIAVLFTDKPQFRCEYAHWNPAPLTTLRRIEQQLPLLAAVGE